MYMMSDNELVKTVLVKTVFAFVLWDSHNALPFRAHMAQASPWCLDRGRAGESPVYPLRDSLWKPSLARRQRPLWGFNMPPRLGHRALVHLYPAAFCAKDTAATRQKGRLHLWKCRARIVGAPVSDGRPLNFRQKLTVFGHVLLSHQLS